MLERPIIPPFTPLAMTPLDQDYMTEPHRLTYDYSVFHHFPKQNISRQPRDANFIRNQLKNLSGLIVKTEKVNKQNNT